jgi:stage II sporulation protein AA (anti-sigma F factor antagonist)
MTIHEVEEAGVLVLSPQGRIDSTTSSRLEQHLSTVAGQGHRRVVVDFSQVDYISSAGLRVMLSLAKRARDQQGRAVLFGMNDGVRQVFELAGFLALFTIAPARADAIQLAAV